MIKATVEQEGTFFLQDVYASWPPLPRDAITHLRIIQVLPKSTPHINTPSVGIPNASPGKQVLGTVPVERDGSAYFRAPAGIPLAFHALDWRGQAVQIMRSITYLQEGENVSCVGCHEPRGVAPPSVGSRVQAVRARPVKLVGQGNPIRFAVVAKSILDYSQGKNRDFGCPGLVGLHQAGEDSLELSRV